MAETILITGGAGFIGSHLADDLLERGRHVRVLDSLVPEVHGGRTTRPAYLSPDVELIVGDVRDALMVERALKGVDPVFHFAARVGIGQSMYQISAYAGANDLGTAVLVEAAAKNAIERLIVASSMSIYGEGLYRDADGDVHPNASRTFDQLQRAIWDPADERGRPLRPIPTPESKAPTLTSVYALSKLAQERLCMLAGRMYGVPTVALRFFNVYGPRQAPSNPYSGELASLASRLLSGRRPVIFEDGRQSRDFLYVGDAVQACRLALESPSAPDHVLNVGSGRPCSVYEIAMSLGEVVGASVEPEVNGKHRFGDIRHCFADIELARRTVGYEPSCDLSDGLRRLAAWLMGRVTEDRGRMAMTAGEFARERTET
jgi:dTDP-L-rhamnose 4-epimerase